MSEPKDKTEAACGGSALTAMLGAAFFAGCTPAPLTDAQVRETTQRCRELGMATAIFNSGIVSRIECIPIIHESVPNK